MMYNTKIKEENQVSAWEHIYFQLDITMLICFCVLILKFFSYRSVTNFKLVTV
jgi:hypothetical protein